MEENTNPVGGVALSVVADLDSSVKTLLTQSTPSLKNRVVNTLVEKELTTRHDKLLKALDMIKEAEKELKKIKPDVEHFDADGNPEKPKYTKTQLDALKAAKKKIADINEAIALALDKGDVTKLNNLTSK